MNFQDKTAVKPSDLCLTIKDFNSTTSQCMEELVELEKQYASMYFYNKVTMSHLSCVMDPVMKTINDILVSLRKAGCDFRVALRRLQENQISHKQDITPDEASVQETRKCNSVFRIMDSVPEMKLLEGGRPEHFCLVYKNHVDVIEDLDTKLGCAILDRIYQPPVVGDVLVGYDTCYFRCCVMFVDFSEVVVVDIDRGEIRNVLLCNLWKCEDKCMNIPAQAVWCSLKNIPVFDTWQYEVVCKLFEKNLTNEVLYVYWGDIGNEIPPTHFVDITTYSQVQNMHLNVSDWLLNVVAPRLNSCDQQDSENLLQELCFKAGTRKTGLHDATDTSGDDRPRDQCMSNCIDLPVTRDLNLFERQVGDEVNTVFLKGDTPTCFYVKQTKTCEFKLFDAYLQKEFGKTRSSLDSHPEVGMHVVINKHCAFRACIVCTASNDEEWHVFAVDEGFISTVDKSHMYKMDAECFKFPPQVLNCCLSGFTDTVDLWSQPLTTGFKNLLEGSVLLLVIDSIMDTNPVKFRVSVKKLEKELEVNVNEQLRKIIDDYECSKVKTIEGGVETPPSKDLHEESLQTTQACCQENSMTLNANTQNRLVSEKVHNGPESTTGYALLEPNPGTEVKGSKYDVYVTHVYNPRKFYIVKMDDAALLRDLSQDLQTHYANVHDRFECKEEARARKNRFWAAAEKGNWQRAEVVDWGRCQSDLLQVLYLDFGHTEWVHFSCLLPLAPHFYACARVAKKCALAWVQPPPSSQNGHWGAAWPEKSIQRFQEIVEQIGVFSMHVEDVQGGFLEIFLSFDHDTMSVNDWLTDGGFAVSTFKPLKETTKRPSSRGNKLPGHRIELPYDRADENADCESNVSNDSHDNWIMVDDLLGLEPAVEVGNTLRVRIAFVADLKTIYVHCVTLHSISETVKSSLYLFQEFNERIHQRSQTCSLRRVKYPMIGNLVLAPFSMDHRLYRARLNNCIEDGKVEIFFVDYGNTEVVAINTLRQMPKDFAQYPFQALRCTLKNVCFEKCKSREGVLKSKKFLEDLEGSILSMKVVDMSNNEPEVYIYDECGEEVGAKVMNLF